MTESPQDPATGTHGGPGVASSVADRELIDDYLAERLAAGPRDAFEARLVAEPLLRRELELTEALREGLATLAARGELAPLLSGAARARRPVLSIAASVAAVLAGLAALVLYQQLERTRDALATANHALRGGVTSAATGLVSLRLMQSRGSDDGPDLAWQRPPRATMVELRIDPGLDPADAYRLRIARLQHPDELPVLMLQRVAVGADGELAMLLHSGLLSPGDYRIDLEPATSPRGPATRSLQFTLQIVD